MRNEGDLTNCDCCGKLWNPTRPDRDGATGGLINQRGGYACPRCQGAAIILKPVCPTCGGTLMWGGYESLCDCWPLPHITRSGSDIGKFYISTDPIDRELF